MAPSLAQACFEPSPPSCLHWLSKDSETYEIEMCRTSVERFRQDMEDYVECVADEAAEEVRKVVRRYNCYARRESYCF